MSAGSVSGLLLYFAAVLDGRAGEPVRHPRFSPAETAPLVKLQEAGLTQKAIAERLGRSPSAVWHRLRRLGRV